ncbi:MAG: RNA-binding protein [Alphaproteobacteria bacterium]|nr:RNA-binding protein [Alphaproteobacteria bacterium SS10]
MSTAQDTATDQEFEQDTLDNGPANSARNKKSGPERRCLVSRQPGPTDRLIRFVLDGEGQVTPDLAEKLPGRGAWVTADHDALETAIEKKLFSRAFKQPVTVDAELPSQLSNLLSQRCLNWLGLARRGGQAVAGSDKVIDWLRRDDAYLLIQASDASPAGRDKVERYGKGARTTARNDDTFTAAELGAVFGRDIAVHVAVGPGSLAESLVRDLDRLGGIGREPPET